MKTIAWLLMGAALAGCLTATPPDIACWDLEFTGDPVAAAQPVFGDTRLQQVRVESPADTRSLTVYRANGTVAFDGYNEFAAQPVHLWHKVAMAAMSASGLFKSVVNSTSSVRAENAVELEVLRWALDCREPETRRAEAKVLLRVVRKGVLVRQTTGSARVDARSGDYGAAFSEAASQAMTDALGKLRQ